MKTRLLVALMCLAARGQSLAAEASTVLWLPAAPFSDWRGLEDLLAKSPKARLTLALDPGEIPPEAQPHLAELVRQGRVEMALRLAGDPLLGLLRPSDLVERLAAAKARYRQIFGVLPTGFVPSGGVLAPQAADLLAAQGLRWAAVGDSPQAAAAWLSAKGLLIVPFRVLSSSATAAKGAAPPRAVVLDEAAGGLPPGAGPALLRELLNSGSWSTAAETFLWSPAPGTAPALWPNWIGEDPFSKEDPLRERALDLRAKASAALDTYQNSGIASLERLDKASAALYAAESSRFYRKNALGDPALEKEFHDLLRSVFKAVRQNPPEELSSSRQEPGSQERARVRLAPGRLEFDGPPALAASTTAQDPWNIRRLEVVWDKNTVSFIASMKKLDAGPEGTQTLGRVRLDLYIDLNHLAGRGSTSLLQGRKGFLRAMDAWEYALEFNGTEGWLYRSSPGQDPIAVQKLSLSVDPKASSVKAVVGRALLRGNPAGWGYLLLSLDQGKTTIGMLGEESDQRFCALRLEKENSKRR